jgi:hypothetical protein
MRLDVHTGNVVAGKVNISASIYNLIKDSYSFTYRGEISAKNKSVLAMYYIDGRLENTIE